MPRERTAYKELRKAKKRHFKNISTKSDLRTSVRNFDNLVAAKKIDEAKKLLPSLISKLDKAASKGIVKSNTASRKISRLMKRLSSGAKA